MPQPHERDLDQTRAQLESWLRTRVPGDGALRVGAFSAPAETGFSSDTLMFELASGGAQAERLVLRLEPRGFRVFPHYDMSVQYRVLDALAKTDVPVPRVRWYEGDPEPLGSSFYVMDRVDGRVPSDRPPYHMDGWIKELSPPDRERLWWSGFEALIRIHRVDWQALGLGFLAEPERGESLLEQQLHYHDEFLSWGLERERFPLLERALAFLRAERPAQPPATLCWGDSRISNQIFDRVECVAVLDWEMVRLGDPVDDLAWWIATDRCFSEGLDLPRLAGLPDRAATVARWEAGTGRRALALDYYEVLGLFRFSAIMGRVIGQLKHYGQFPEESPMDRDNLASVTLARKLAELGA